jgi:glycosyltransferase involved in cell wall biosynthesis
MCTLNGARFLPAQLASLERQTFQNWRLFISDDGSTDDTVTILRAFAQRQPQRVEIRTGPSRGPSLNFLSLAADRKIDADYFAFCDQDDVWHPTKLERAVTQLCAAPEHLPAVYGGRTRLVATDGKPFGHSYSFSKPPSFANALAQSIAGANTMLLNRAAKRLLERAGPLNVVSHDWWTYQLVVGSGGVFLYDREPHLDYRQHEANCIGCNRGLAAQWKRFRMVLNGGFGRWNNINLQALQQSRHLLTLEARARLDAYETMRNSHLAKRLRVFWTSNIRRQTFAGNVALFLAILLKRI